MQLSLFMKKVQCWLTLLSATPADHPVGHAQAWTSLALMNDRVDVAVPLTAMQKHSKSKN